jgi:hypothetical protein
MSSFAKSSGSGGVVSTVSGVGVMNDTFGVMPKETLFFGGTGL